MLKKLKNFIKVIAKFLRERVFVKDNLVPALLGEATFWSPLIVLAVLAICVSPTYWLTFGAVYCVWVVLLPAIPIQILFIYLWAKLLNFFRRKRRKK